MSNKTDDELDVILKDFHTRFYDAFDKDSFSLHTTADNLLKSSLEALIARERQEAEAEGMRKAKARVLRRTQIPRDARNPRRDHVVILGEEIAAIIQADIDEVTPKERKE